MSDKWNKLQKCFKQLLKKYPWMKSLFLVELYILFGTIVFLYAGFVPLGYNQEQTVPDVDEVVNFVGRLYSM